MSISRILPLEISENPAYYVTSDFKIDTKKR